MKPTQDDIRTVLRCIGHAEHFDLVIHLSGGCPDYLSPTGRFGLLALPRKTVRESGLTAKKWKQQLALGAKMIAEMGLEKYLSPLSDTDREFLEKNESLII